MRRFIAIIGLFIYAYASAATAVHLHYCDGKWMAIKEPGAHSSCHSTLAKHPVKDCCKHPKIKISLNADQLITHPDAYKFFPLVASSSHQEVLKPIIYRLSEVATICQSPPLYSKAIERLAQFSVFLI